MPTAAMVGAGLSGLSCAGALTTAGWTVRVFDKGRGPGGRASTRRVVLPTGGEVAFDHGAQYMTARDPAFAAQLERWCAAGVAARWPAAGTDAWVGTPSMSAPVAALAAGLAVQWRARVEALIPGAQGWRVMVDGETIGPFDAAVIALPAEQARDLAAGPDGALAALASDRPSDPCWTVMLAFEQRLPVGDDILTSPGDLSWAARNSAKPMRGPIEAWVLQASPAWSRAHLEDDADRVIEAMQRLFADRIGAGVPDPIVAQAHRWRYARSARGDEGGWWHATLRLGACGDWLRGPRIENAWLSGRLLAERMLNPVPD